LVVGHEVRFPSIQGDAVIRDRRIASFGLDF
jgi:hypothetical protein